MARAHIHRVTHDIIIPLILRQIPRWLNHTGRAVNHTGRLMWAWPALAVLSSLNRGGRWIQSWPPLNYCYLFWPHPHTTFRRFLNREFSFPRSISDRDADRDGALCRRFCLLGIYSGYHLLCNCYLTGQAIVNRVVLCFFAYRFVFYLFFFLPKNKWYCALNHC